MRVIKATWWHVAGLVLVFYAAIFAIVSVLDLLLSIVQLLLKYVRWLG